MITSNGANNVALACNSNGNVINNDDNEEIIWHVTVMA